MEFSSVLVRLEWEKLPSHTCGFWFSICVSGSVCLSSCNKSARILHLKDSTHVPPRTLAKTNKDVDENFKISLVFNRLGVESWVCLLPCFVTLGNLFGPHFPQMATRNTDIYFKEWFLQVIYKATFIKYLAQPLGHGRCWGNVTLLASQNWERLRH